MCQQLVLQNVDFLSQSSWSSFHSDPWCHLFVCSCPTGLHDATRASERSTLLVTTQKCTRVTSWSFHWMSTSPFFFLVDVVQMYKMKREHQNINTAMPTVKTRWACKHLSIAPLHGSQRAVIIPTMTSQRFSSKGDLLCLTCSNLPWERGEFTDRAFFSSAAATTGREAKDEGIYSVYVSVHVQCVSQYDTGKKKNKPQRRIRCARFSGGYRVIALHLILSELESLPEGKKRILGHERFIDSLTKHIVQVSFLVVLSHLSREKTSRLVVEDCTYLPIY